MSNKETARKRRKKRLMKKRIKATTILILGILLAVFAVKGLIGLITGEGVEASSQPQSSTEATNTPRLTPEPPQIPQPNDYTLLVNRENPLSEDYDVETRKVVNNGVTTDYMFDARVADRLEAMLAAAAADGCPVLIRSAHRTISYQKMLYTNKVNEYLNMGYAQAAAETEAAKWVAIPGTSEHNLGLVVDIVNVGYTGPLDQYFEDDPLFDWLIKNCADYGFILRYPKTKESVTGIVYEPWHYRYVGEDVAHYIMDNDITLEEYWEDIKSGKSRP